MSSSSALGVAVCCRMLAGEYVSFEPQTPLRPESTSGKIYAVPSSITLAVEPPFTGFYEVFHSETFALTPASRQATMSPY